MKEFKGKIAESWLPTYENVTREFICDSLHKILFNEKLPNFKFEFREPEAIEFIEKTLSEYSKEYKYYEQYSKEVCALDKLEYECTDEVCKSELDKEREKSCSKYYLKDKTEKERINESALNNFLISFSTTIVIFTFLHILNKKYN